MTGEAKGRANKEGWRMAMGNLPPIEEPQAYGGLLPAIWQTWVAACFRPREFFESVSNSQNLTPALLFGIGCGWLGIFFVSLWATVIQLPFLPMLPSKEAQEQLVGGAAQIFCSGLCGWLNALIGILLGGLLLHLFLALFGGANQGLTVTLRVVAYAQAPVILAVVPLLGCVGGIWGLVLYIVGLAAAHRTETWRSALAVFAPVILCIGILVIGAVLIALFAASVAKGP
jgi:hypothetical protein